MLPQASNDDDDFVKQPKKAKPPPKKPATKVAADSSDVRPRPAACAQRARAQHPSMSRSAAPPLRVCTALPCGAARLTLRASTCVLPGGVREQLTLTRTLTVDVRDRRRSSRARRTKKAAPKAAPKRAVQEEDSSEEDDVPLNKKMAAKKKK